MDRSVYEVRLQKWIGIMQEYGASGMSKAAWCELHGIKRRSFFYWQKKLQEYALEKMHDSKEGIPGSKLSLTQGTNTVTFCEISPKQLSPKASNPERMEVVPFQAEMAIQVGGYNILIGSNVSERALSTVLGVIGHA